MPHEKYGDVTGSESEGVRFRGTPESCRWAYLLRTPRLELPAGEYILDLRIEISSGQLYGGVLDIEKNEFIVQQELQSETTRIQFALAEDRLIDVIIRQGAKDTPVSAIYRYGQTAAFRRALRSQQKASPQRKIWRLQKRCSRRRLPSTTVRRRGNPVAAGVRH